MHKVGGNYSSCTCRSSENICSSSRGAQEKGKTGSRPHETQFGTKSGAFLSLTPSWRLMYFFGGFSLISPVFGPNSRVLVPCFPDLTENSTEHPENRCAYVLIPLKVIRKDAFWGFQKVSFQWEKTGGQVLKRLWLYVKTSDSHSETVTKTLKVLIENVRTAQHWFLPVF
jgi:hypothetical protein